MCNVKMKTVRNSNPERALMPTIQPLVRNPPYICRRIAIGLMIFSYLKMNMEVSDDDFNSLYPEPIQQLAKRHWTPVEVAKMAAEFLVTSPSANILDIGSGSGKFCLIGAACTPGHFTGVEQRQSLVELSNSIAKKNELHNVNFIHANITEIDFKAYTGFYFYNSFQENIEADAKIDESVETNMKFYGYYSDYVNSELARKPIGTRIVTYWSSLSEIPSNYQLLFTAFNDRLKFWEKSV